jgi:hypothetical protein
MDFLLGTGTLMRIQEKFFVKQLSPLDLVAHQTFAFDGTMPMDCLLVIEKERKARWAAQKTRKLIAYLSQNRSLAEIRIMILKCSTLVHQNADLLWVWAIGSPYSPMNRQQPRLLGCPVPNEP